MMNLMYWQCLKKRLWMLAPIVSLDKATTYESAVKLLESKPYDVVILDIMGVVVLTFSNWQSKKT